VNVTIRLKAGREKSLLRRHPWIFSGGIQHVDGPAAAPGATVDLLSFNKQFLARASYSPASQIRARVWTFEDEPVDKEFFRRRIQASLITRQKSNVESQSNAYRLIYAESDNIPGLIVDRYGDVLVLQSLTAGSEFWKETFADLLLEETGCSTLYERSDADVRELEGLAPKVGVLRGSILHDPLTITENELQFKVDLASGHKTGWQRIRMCWIASATPAGSRSMHWRAEQSLSCP
jgi:23S rRNA (cytosine1962-C5)-methyltransferase